VNVKKSLALKKCVGHLLKEKNMIAERPRTALYDARHGGPYDRGSADSYYSRGFNPHYFEGDTAITPRVEMAQMTAAEITAYTAGFNDNESFGDKKDWG
jgi:hypothetical protein